MAGATNAAPVIIKRKKVVGGGGHHGGAWKVAYADFVTAMMAFFMLMWLLNATTEKQRKGIADYFNPTVPVNRISGGGDGAFGGDSIFSEEMLPKTGTGAASQFHADNDKAEGATGMEAQDSAKDAELAALQEKIDSQLMAKSGESMFMEALMRHVVTRISDQGLVIEIFDRPEASLFAGDSAEPTQTRTDLLHALPPVLALVTNGIAVEAHVKTYPRALRQDPSWDLSLARAQKAREMLQQSGTDGARMQRVVAHGDRKPAELNAAAPRNNRIELILLRGGQGDNS